MLDQQWIHAMLRLSSKAVALIIKIEKTICVPPRDPCSMQAVRRAGRTGGEHAGVCELTGGMLAA